MPLQEQEGDGDIAPTVSQPDTRRRWVVAATLRRLYPRECSSTHCVRGAGCASGSVWTVRKISLPLGLANGLL